METISKIMSLMKIPIKVLLPTLCIFSGFAIFATDEILKRLNLFEWCNKNGFVLGLIFLITICLIFVYSIYYIKNIIKKYVFRVTYKRKTINKILKMNSKQIDIILYLYQSEGYSERIDYADPNVKALIATKFIYIGNNAPVELGWDNEMLINGTLNPFVWQSLRWINEKLNKKIKKLTYRKQKAKKLNKIDRINKDILDYTQILERLGGKSDG